MIKNGNYKQSFFISTNDGGPTAFAGIWDKATINGITIESCSIITTECNDLMRPIHDRMPVILPLESLDSWLTPTELPIEVLEFFMKPYNSEKMQFWPVSTEVNKSINEGEHLVHPVPVATEK